MQDGRWERLAEPWRTSTSTRTQTHSACSPSSGAWSPPRLDQLAEPDPGRHRAIDAEHAQLSTVRASFRVHFDGRNRARAEDEPGGPFDPNPDVRGFGVEGGFALLQPPPTRSSSQARQRGAPCSRTACSLICQVRPGLRAAAGGKGMTPLDVRSGRGRGQRACDGQRLRRHAARHAVGGPQRRHRDRRRLHVPALGFPDLSLRTISRPTAMRSATRRRPLPASRSETRRSMTAVQPRYGWTNTSAPRSSTSKSETTASSSLLLPRRPGSSGNSVEGARIVDNDFSGEGYGGVVAATSARWRVHDNDFCDLFIPPSAPSPPELGCRRTRRRCLSSSSTPSTFA